MEFGYMIAYVFPKDRKEFYSVLDKSFGKRYRPPAQVSPLLDIRFEPALNEEEMKDLTSKLKDSDFGDFGFRE